MPVGVAQSQLVPQRLDTHRTPALFAAQRWEAVGLELARNGLQRPARRSQFLHAGTDVGIVRALPIASNRTHEHTFRLAASRPGDADLHLLARALRLDLHPLDHLANDFFAVCCGGRRSVPQGRNIGGKPANGRAFLTRQDAWLLLEEAMIVLLERLLGLQFLLPGPLERPGDQPVLRLHRLVLPRRSFDLVSGPAPPLLPE